jgi:germacradienol/geosmin synthase
MALDVRRQFRDAVHVMTSSWLWELANQIQHRVPDPVDYLEMRRKTFGSDLTMSLARISYGQMVPPGVYQTRTLRSLDNSAADYACLTNDIFSYQKEIQFEGELHNGVLIIQRFLDVDTPAAVAITNDLMTQRLQQFEHLAANELPFVLEALDAPAREGVVGYVEHLRDWMAGVLHWHRGTHRYNSGACEANARQIALKGGDIQARSWQPAAAKDRQDVTAGDLHSGTALWQRAAGGFTGPR